LSPGRSISNDGLRIVWSAFTAPNASQVFLFDGRNGNTIRQITNLTSRVSDVPLNPTISGDGKRIAFATRRTVVGAGGNSDGSAELYTYDIPSGTPARITNVNAAGATAEVVSSLNNDGSMIVFNFSRLLSGPVSNEIFENDSEIYLATVPGRPSGSLTILNQASLGHEPAVIKAVAPDSIAAARGSSLSFVSEQSLPTTDGSFPSTLGGTVVTVNGEAAQLLFVSPTEVQFHVPPNTAPGTLEVVITNSDGFQSRGTVMVLGSAPGVFTVSGDGVGEALVLNADTQQAGPFDPTGGNLRLVLFGTGIRNAASVEVSAGGRALAVETVVRNSGISGMDEIHLHVPDDLRGAGVNELLVTADGRDANPVTVEFSGDSLRDVLINEFLADPPDGLAGDANRDGVRDSSQDEFIELVNTTAHDIDLSGYRLFTQTTSTNTLRHRFPNRTILRSCNAVLVFGGGNASFNPDDPAFGGSLVMKASTGGLSLINSGITISLQDPMGDVVNFVTYGGSSGIKADNNQSVTRSPDIVGMFASHQIASGGERLFSPGTQINGQNFNPCTPAIARIEITPSSAVLQVGGEQQFSAAAFDSANKEIPGVIFSWTSGNPSVADIDENGRATAVSAGVTEIYATGRGLTSTPSTLTVKPLPSLSIADVSQPETDSGATIFSFTVTASEPAPASGITFDIATQDGSATAASGDYVAKNLSAQTLAAGNTTITFEVLINGDRLVEPDEMFSVQLSNVTGATIDHGQAHGTLQNDDAPNIVISQIYGGGNNAGAIYRNDFVELFNRGTTIVDFAVTPYSVQYAGVGSNFGSNKTNLTAGVLSPGHYFLIQESGGTSNGVALPMADATGTIALGSTSGKVALALGTSSLSSSTCPGDNGSTPFNPAEAALADFVGYGSTANTTGHCYEGAGPASPPGNAIAVLRKAGGCVDSNDNASDFLLAGPFPRNNSAPPNGCVMRVPPNLTVDDITVAEGNSGTTIATFTARLSAMPSSDVTFDIATHDGTATSGSDYVAKSLANQVIPAGQQSYTFNVNINGDTTVENDETFTVNLTNVVGANLTDPEAVATIRNDDLPSLAINDVIQKEGDSGDTVFSFFVSLSAPAPTGGVSFDIATGDDTATVSDNDYTARKLTNQMIAAGSATYTFDVIVKGDANIEPDETFLINVSNVVGATIADGQGIGTILNDDAPVLSISDVTQLEGDTGTTTFVFTVSSSLPAPAGGINFDIATHDGTATATTGDYIARALSNQTISAGNTTYMFAVTVNGDNLVEPNESFVVNVANVGNATIGDGQGVGTIQNDDTPKLVISQIYGGGGNASATYTNDFIEIFNRGTTIVDFSITPHSVQYAAATSNFSTNKTDLLAGVLMPGHYFLIREGSGGSTGGNLPTPDASGSVNLSATAGKVALVSGTGALSGSGCALSVAVVDFLGYGSSANCFETAPVPVSSTNSNARSVIRTLSCNDTNNNLTDFSNPTTAPIARNTSTTPLICP